MDPITEVDEQFGLKDAFAIVGGAGRTVYIFLFL
jgi:hypothetical protein